MRAEPAPARRGLTSFGIALLGTAISAYLTVEHYDASSTLACPESRTINCAKVTSSAWSHIGGLPVAVLGLVYFVVMAALCSPPAWRRRELDIVRIVGSAGGVAFAIYLVWAELFRVDAICPWCTAVHMCALALLIAVLWQVTQRAPGV